MRPSGFWELEAPGFWFVGGGRWCASFHLAIGVGSGCCLSLLPCSQNPQKRLSERHGGGVIWKAAVLEPLSFPPLVNSDLSCPLRGLVSSTWILLDTSDRNPRSEIPRSTVLWGYTDTAGWHPQLSACWVGTDSDNRPAGNPEFSMTPSSFPRHLPGRCCEHRVLTLYWSPTVDETQVPLLRELTVLWGEMKTPWPSEVWFQPCRTTLLTAGELLIQSSWCLQPTGEKGHINTSWSIFTEDVLWAVDQSCPWTRAISVE